MRGRHTPSERHVSFWIGRDTRTVHVYKLHVISVTIIGRFFKTFFFLTRKTFHKSRAPGGYGWNESGSCRQLGEGFKPWKRRRCRKFDLYVRANQRTLYFINDNRFNVPVVDVNKKYKYKTNIKVKTTRLCVKCVYAEIRWKCRVHMHSNTYDARQPRDKHIDISLLPVLPYRLYLEN